MLSRCTVEAPRPPQRPQVEDERSPHLERAVDGDVGEPREGQAQRETQPSQPKQTQREGQKGEGKAPKAAEGKGSAGGSGGVQLTSEQRTKIRTTVLQGGNAPRVTNVNFNVSVGTVVPRSVRVVAVPAMLIEIHPEWRGMMYFVAGERIIIVDDSHKIVAVLVV